MSLEKSLILFSFSDPYQQFLENSKNEFEKVLVDVGPNKFTTLRKNLAFAKAYSEVKGIEIFGFSFLECLVHFLRVDSISIKSRTTQAFGFSKAKGFEVISFEKEDSEKYTFFEIGKLSFEQINEFKKFIFENISKFQKPITALYLQEADAIANIPKPIIENSKDDFLSFQPQITKLPVFQINELKELIFKSEELFPKVLRQPRSQIEKQLENRNALFVYSKKAVAYCWVNDPSFEFPTAHLLSIAVFESFQNQGVGKQLLLKVIDELSSRGIERLFLEVEETNISALKLYESLGFKKLGFSKIKLPTSNKQIEMILEITKSNSFKLKLEKTVKFEELELFASEFARSLKKGDLVFLRGDLGSGKTSFTSAVAKAFGISEVVSPSFSVAKEYVINNSPKDFENLEGVRFLHIDAYRHLNLESKTSTEVFAELSNSGIFEDSEEKLTFLEWGESFKGKVDAKRCFEIRIERVDETIRQFKVYEIGDGC